MPSLQPLSALRMWRIRLGRRVLNWEFERIDDARTGLDDIYQVMILVKGNTGLTQLVSDTLILSRMSRNPCSRRRPVGQRISARKMS
jgi:hypothetical protein